MLKNRRKARRYCIVPGIIAKENSWTIKQIPIFPSQQQNKQTAVLLLYPRRSITAPLLRHRTIRPDR